MAHAGPRRHRRVRDQRRGGRREVPSRCLRGLRSRFCRWQCRRDAPRCDARCDSPSCAQWLASRDRFAACGVADVSVAPAARAAAQADFAIRCRWSRVVCRLRHGEGTRVRTDPLVAAILGMLTGIGGGMLRDLLVNEIPTVLHGELYALAALAGAAVVVAGHVLDLPPTVPTMIGGAVLCFGIRLISIRRGWSLPTADRIARHLPNQR